MFISAGWASSLYTLYVKNITANAFKNFRYGVFFNNSVFFKSINEKVYIFVLFTKTRFSRIQIGLLHLKRFHSCEGYVTNRCNFFMSCIRYHSYQGSHLTCHHLHKTVLLFYATCLVLMCPSRLSLTLLLYFVV